MKIKKCVVCGEYTLMEKCGKCGNVVKDAHYKFVKIRDVRNPK
jgi:rRNA maturation protein Nop10